ncbi:hypothetical protein V1523DRAFT_374637 [Lipomyces doorenjongii]
MNGVPRPVPNHPAGSWKEGLSLNHRQAFATSLVESLKKIPIGGPPERIAKYAQQTENNAFDTAQSRDEYFAIMRERIEYVRNTVDRRRNAVLNNGQVVVPQGQATHQSQPPQPPQQPLPSQHQAQFVPQQRPPEDMFNTMPMNQQPQQINPVAQFQQQQPQVQQPPQATGQAAVPNVSGNQPQYNAAYQNALRQLMSQQQHQQQQNQQGRSIPIGMQPQQGQSSISSQVTPQQQQQNIQTPRNAALLAMMQQQQARLQAQAQQGNVPTQQQQQSNQQIAQQIRQRLAQNGGRNNPTELQAMLQMLKQQQQRQQQAPQLQQQDQTSQQIQPPPQQQQDSQTSISMQQVRSATGQLLNDGNAPNNYTPIQQAQVQMFRKLVQAQKQQQQQSAVTGQIQQPRQMGPTMNATAQQQPMMPQSEQPMPSTQQQQSPQQPQQPSQQQNAMPRNGPHQRIATAQSAGRLAANVQQAEQGHPPQLQLTRQQLDSTVKNYVLKSKIPQALLKMMPFLPSDVNTWTQIYNLMKSNSIPSDALPIIRNVHAQNEQLVRNLFAKQGQQAQRLVNDAQTPMPVGQKTIAVPGAIQQAVEDAKSSPVMINQQPINQRPGVTGSKIDDSPSLPRIGIPNLQQHQLPQGSQPQQSTMNQQASMTIPHQYPSGQNTTPVMQQQQQPQQQQQQLQQQQQQQQQQAQMMYNKILSQSPQRKQATPTIQHSQIPPHQPSQQNQWMVDAQQSQQQAAVQQQQEPLQAYIQQQNPSGQFGAEGAANVQRPSYGPEQQERDRTRIRELYEEVSRSRAKQSPVELPPEDQTKTREMILQLQEACRQMDRLIHWAHVNFHNESVTKRLMAMQFAYRDQFEVLNRGIFYFTPESIAKFRVELSKFFNYVRRHQQLKQGNGGVALPVNMGTSMQQSVSGQVLQQQSQQAVAQGTPQQHSHQAQLPVNPRRPPQPQMMLSMPQQGGQQMSFEPNLAFAADQQRQRQGNTVSTPTTTNVLPPQPRPMQQQQQMMSQDQQQQAVSAGSFPAQQFVPQSMPEPATPVSAPIPAPNARQPARRNQKATVAAATHAQVAVTAATGNAHSTPQNQVLTSQRPNFSLPGEVPAAMSQAQLGTSEPDATAPETSPVISSSTSPQGVPIYSPTPLLEATQLKLPQSRKRPLGGIPSGKSTGSSPVVDSEPPLKKERTEPRAGPKGKQASVQAKAVAAAQALAVATEDANAKQRAAAEEVARKRRELAEKDPLGYALQAVADICGVDPQTGKDIEVTESSTTGILSQVKIMYSEILRGIC